MESEVLGVKWLFSSLLMEVGLNFEPFARVNTSVAHIPQYLREGQSQILLKNSANYIFSSYGFLWEFTDTFF